MRESFGPSPETRHLNVVAEAENDRRAAEFLERLEPSLREEAEDLRAEGFPVADDCRIDPDTFRDIFNAAEIANDERIASSYVAKRSPGAPQRGEDMGRLLESVTTIAVNQALFAGRLLALRTAALDDYHHGVDYLIVDPETHAVLAAADATTSPEGKSGRLQENIKNGMSVRYGVSTAPEGVRRGPLEHLPYFILNMRPEDVLSLAEELLMSTEKGPVARRIEARLLETFRDQASHFGSIATGNVRAAYGAAGKIFEEIKEALGKERKAA